MELKERNKMIKHLVGTRIGMTSGQLKDFDYEAYDAIEQNLQGFVTDEDNKTTEEELELFKKGTYLIELYFDKNGRKLTAGKTDKEVADQPYWGECGWDDLTDDQIHKYYDFSIVDLKE